MINHVINNVTAIMIDNKNYCCGNNSDIQFYYKGNTNVFSIDNTSINGNTL